MSKKLYRNDIPVTSSFKLCNFFYPYFNLLFKKGLGEVSVLVCEVTLSEYAEFPVPQYYSLEPLSPPLVSAWSKIKICIRASL